MIRKVRIPTFYKVELFFRDSNVFRFFASYAVKRALTFFDVYDFVRR